MLLKKIIKVLCYIVFPQFSVNFQHSEICATLVHLRVWYVTSAGEVISAQRDAELNKERRKSSSRIYPIGVLLRNFLPHSLHFFIFFCSSGMALGFFNLGPGTRMFGQIGVPSIFWGSQKSWWLSARKRVCFRLWEKESNQLGINIAAYAYA